jgi:hypothetical protein
VFAFAEIGCMAWWLLDLRRSAREQRILARIFLVGATVAACWAMFVVCLIAKAGTLAPLILFPVNLMAGSPFACTFFYAFNARLAWERSLELAVAASPR